MSRAVIIVWFRQDLRVIDHPALTAAVDRGDVIIPVYIWSPEEEGNWPMGAAGRWWLHHALARLDEALQGLGSCLVLRKGTSLEVLRTLISQTRANRVCWCRRYSPAGIVQDNRIMTSLQTAGTDVEQYGGHVLFEPESVQTQSGNFYQVFSPFWKACLSLPEPEKPLEAPEALHAPDHFPDSLSLDQLALLPEINWTEGNPAGQVPWSVLTTLSETPYPPTQPPGIGRTSWVHRACRLICISAKSVSDRSGMRSADGRLIRGRRI